MGRGGGPAALCHQRAELRPLQDLRHQGPEPEHHLGAARRRRRTELSEYVIKHCETILLLNVLYRLCCERALPRFRRRWGLKADMTRQRRMAWLGVCVLAGLRQKRHSCVDIEEASGIRIPL